MAEGIKKIGVMTCGGDCPGLNPVVRAVVLSAINDYGWEVLGIEDSMQGLINLNYKSPFGNRWLSVDMVDDIITKGGSILGNDNKSHPFKFAVKQPDGTFKIEDVSATVNENFRSLGLDALIVIGGDGSQRIAYDLYEKYSIPVVGVPKTIDNDLDCTDYTFGFTTSVQTIVDAVDKIQDTARSHDRIIIVEVMGRDAGWLALYSGIAGNAQIIIIPEIPYKMDGVKKCVQGRIDSKKPFLIIVLAEGAICGSTGCSAIVDAVPGAMPKYVGAGDRFMHEMIASEANCGLEVRVSNLGYIQRGGSPCNFDRILGTRFGCEAVRLCAEKKWGQMVSLKTPDIVSVSMLDATHTQKKIDPNSQIVKHAKQVGICFAD